MKKIIVSLIIIFGITGVASASWYNPFSWFGEIKKEINLGATILYPYQGGTGTSTAPTYGQMLVGNSGGTYTLTATSSLGITAVGDGPGTVSTSTTPVIGNLAYWTSTAYPSLLGTVATTTPTMTAPLTYSGTLGSFVGGVAGTFDCTSATGSVKGCLTAADWTTFNNKQATISATWPITLSGSAVGFDGLSTSTAAVVGNIPYFSGVNTFANVATTSLTATSPLSLSQPISVIGSSASALTISVAGDWTGTIDGNNFAGGAIGAGELIYGGSAGSFSELAVSTDGFILTLSGGIPAWTATTSIPLGGDVTGTLSATVVGNDSHAHTGSTLSSIDIGDDTNLTCGTNCTLTGDDISVDDAFLLNTGDTGTGVYDFGGATSLEVTNGASPTVDATGEIAVDTTSDQLVYYGASEKKQIVPFYTMGFSYGSTTQGSGTTTRYLAPAIAAITITEVHCDFSNFMGISLYDGTNRADYLVASSTISTFTYTTNNTFTANESIRVDIGTSTNINAAVNGGCRFKNTYNAD